MTDHPLNLSAGPTRPVGHLTLDARNISSLVRTLDSSLAWLERDEAAIGERVCVPVMPWQFEQYPTPFRVELLPAEPRPRPWRRWALIVLAAAVSAVVTNLVIAAIADARPTAHFVRSATSVRVSHSRVSGHKVRIVSWRPGDRLVRAQVGYSRTRRTVPAWARASHHRSRSVAAMNGGTWHWRNNRPIGTVWSRGRRITRVDGHPAVGFLTRGRVVFGARSARQRGSVNILAGEAVLIRHGSVLRRYPWANAAQETCGPRGTNGGAGCWRSNVVRFQSGRVALVEVAYATMRQTAAILRALHATAAVTFDSGGSSNLWTLRGRGGCAARRAAGRCFGIAHAAGLHWERQVPDAIVVSVKRR